MSNKPLLRLLSTALFHPLSPDATSAPKVARPNTYRTAGHDDLPTLRLDTESVSESEDFSTSSSSSFVPPSTNPHANQHSGGDAFAFGRGNYDHLTDFGGESTSTSGGDSPDNNGYRESLTDSSDFAVYILAPVLAQVLEGDVSATRSNPYRRVLLACLRRGAGLEHGGSLQSAAAVTFDAAITRLDGTARAVLEACGMVPRQRTQNSSKALESLLASLDFDDEDDHREGGDDNTGKDRDDGKDDDLIVGNLERVFERVSDFPRNKPTDSLFDDEFDEKKKAAEGEREEKVEQEVGAMKKKEEGGERAVQCEKGKEEGEEEGSSEEVANKDRDRALSGTRDAAGEAEHAYPPTPEKPPNPPSPASILESTSVAEVISSLCAGLITTPARGKDDVKYMAYGFVCAHALTLLVSGDEDSKATFVDVCKHYIRRSANYIANSCEVSERGEERRGKERRGEERGGEERRGKRGEEEKGEEEKELYNARSKNPTLKLFSLYIATIQDSRSPPARHLLVFDGLFFALLFSS